MFTGSDAVTEDIFKPSFHPSIVEGGQKYAQPFARKYARRKKQARTKHAAPNNVTDRENEHGNTFTRPSHAFSDDVGHSFHTNN